LNAPTQATAGLLLSLVLFGTDLGAQTLYSFGNLSLNRLDWNHTPKRPRRDFSYLELEGGAGYRWGELYGFADLENFDRASDQHSVLLKGQLRYYLDGQSGRAGPNLFLQSKAAQGQGWHEYSQVLGLGYNLKLGQGWFSPFAGPLYTDTGWGFSGWNGHQLGWAANLPFKIGQQSMMLANWNEIDLARQRHYLPAGAARPSWNGALSLWWKASERWSLGLKYRYARDTLGAAGWTDAWIATLKVDLP